MVGLIMSKFNKLYEANKLFREGQYDSALKIYDEFICLNPDLAYLAHFNKAVIHNRMGNNFYDLFNEDYSKLSEIKVLVNSGKKISVDVIVPVYNALVDVKNCLRALASNSDGFIVNYYIINDKSNSETSMWLEDFCKNRERFHLYKNEENLGYTKSINKGLKLSTSDYIVTLNSDTIVTPGWLSSMISCAEGSDDIGIVGPLSNAASWQNIPLLKDVNGQFAINQLPNNLSPMDVAALASHISYGKNVYLPFINGFCFLIKRKVVETIGYLDEVCFPKGYGEENDYCIRANDAGFRLMVVDNAYVYHAKSKSFGGEVKKLLSAEGDKSIRKKHSDAHFEFYLNKLRKEQKNLDSTRSLFQQVFAQKNPLLISDALSLSILFLLPVGGTGGGIHSIVQEAMVMRKMGVNAGIAIVSSTRNSYLKNYSNIDDIDDLFIPYNNINELKNICSDFDVVVATIYSSVKILKEIYSQDQSIIPAYYIQDYEPYFFEEGSEKYKIAYESYDLIKDCIGFAKTEWIIDTVTKNHSLTVYKVNPSLDHSVYYPRRKNLESDSIKLCAMVRFASPRRAPVKTLKILKALKETFNNKIHIEIFGSALNDNFYLNNNMSFIDRIHGEIDRENVASILSNSDIFIDLSDYQAFGRTAIEAMASGCVPVITEVGGVDEFAIGGKNCLLVNPFDEPAIIKALTDLIHSRNLINVLKINALETAANFSINKAVISELKLFSKIATLRGHVPKNSIKETVLICPVLLKNGSGDFRPAGSAYVRLIKPYNSLKTDGFRVKILNKPVLPKPGVAKYFICQRDLSGIGIEDFVVWAKNWRKTGGKIIYDIDDDLMDINGIIQRTNRSIEEANALKAKVETIARLVDVVTVSTKPLQKIMSSFNDRVVYIPNLLDEQQWWISTKRSESEDSFKKGQDDIIRIGYIGTPTHDRDLDIVESAIKTIEAKHKNKILVEVIGGFEKTKPKFGNRVPLPKKTDYPSFVEWLDKRVNWDIGIIPLVEDRFNNSKSYLKFLEYAALDLAIVCSNVPTYREVAVNEKNCLLVNNDQSSWIEAIERLIADCKLRKELASQARMDLVHNHTIQANNNLFMQVFELANKEYGDV